MGAGAEVLESELFSILFNVVLGCAVPPVLHEIVLLADPPVLQSGPRPLWRLKCEVRMPRASPMPPGKPSPSPTHLHIAENIPVMCRAPISRINKHVEPENIEGWMSYTLSKMTTKAHRQPPTGDSSKQTNKQTNRQTNELPDTPTNQLRQRRHRRPRRPLQQQRQHHSEVCGILRPGPGGHPEAWS